jgi:g-D-glutamyl-meso-diaminopimelate peptidase
MERIIAVFLTISCGLLTSKSLAVSFTQVHDTLRADSVPPRQYDFLLNDSLIRYYVVEDTVKYTYDMIRADLQYFVKRYPLYVHPETPGKSEFGLDLTTVRIGRSVPNKRCVFLVGNIHAREDYSSKLLMKFLNVYLLAIEGKSSLYPNAKNWLDSIDIYIMPVANPDGLKIAHEDWSAIKDSFDLVKDDILLEDKYTEWKANGRGIDLNTTFDDGNFSVKKGGAFHECPASEGYKGTSPAQPVETQCLQRFVQQHKPLITASFHTKGNILFWADAKTHPIFRNIDTEIAKKASAASGFQVSSVSKNPADYGCGLENYVRARLGLIGVCVELSRGDKTRFQHPDNRFNEETWLKAWQLPYLYIENALHYGDRIEQYGEEYRERLPAQ